MAYLDRVLQLVAVAKNRLQLVAMCCLTIAAKYEEAEEHVPSLAGLNDLVTVPYLPEVAHQTEVLVLERLGWTLSVVTPVHFIGLYFRMVCVCVCVPACLPVCVCVQRELSMPARSDVP